jgi:hypothetical protein
VDAIRKNKRGKKIMSGTIPQYDSNIEIKTPSVSVPTAPAAITPLAPPVAAFGGQVAEANAQRGQQVEKIGALIGQRIIERQEHQDMTQVVDKDTQFRKDMDTMLLDPTPLDETGKATGVLSRKLNHAHNATIDFDAAYQKKKAEYLDSVAGDTQKVELGKLLDSHYTAARSTVIRHEAQQGDEYHAQVLDANLAQRIADAGKFADPVALRADLDSGLQIQATAYAKMGRSPEETKLKGQEYADNYAKAAVQAKLESNPAAARAIFETLKPSMTEVGAVAVDEALQGKEFYDKAAQTWNTLKLTDKGADGLPDTTAMEKSVMAMDLPTDKKEKMLNYINSKASDETRQIHAQRDALTTQFKDQLVTVKTQGATLDDAMKLATTYGYSPFDVATKQEMVKSLYTKPQVSETSEYLRLWEGIQTKTATQDDIDNAAKLGKLSVSDWEGLRKNLFTAQQDGIKEETRLMWEIVADKVKSSVPKKDVDAAMYVIKTKAQGKSPEEIRKIAEDELAHTGSRGGLLWLRREQPYKNNFKKMDDENMEMGAITEKVGPVVAGILQSQSLEEKQTVEQIVSKYGGIEQLNDGSPYSNAIKSLRDQHYVVTPAAVKTVLRNYPDGRIPGSR